MGIDIGFWSEKEYRYYSKEVNNYILLCKMSRINEENKEIIQDLESSLHKYTYKHDQKEKKKHVGKLSRNRQSPRRGSKTH